MSLTSFLLCYLFFFSAHSEDIYTLPKQYVFASPLDDEFSDRLMTAPYTLVKPQPLQITSPQFENLFNTLATVQSRSNGSPSTSLRGSSQVARVLFLLDNIPLNFLDGFGASTLFVPTEILKSIHVFEGPTSASYGSSALGGAIHFISQRRETSLLRVGLSDTDTRFIQSEGTLSTANIAVITPLIQTSHYHLQASAFLEKDRGDYPFTAPNGKNDRRQNNSQNLRRFTLKGTYKDESWQFDHLMLYTGLNKRTPGSLYFPSITDQNSDAFFAGFNSQYNISDSLLWTSRFSHSRLHSDFYFGINSYSNSQKNWTSQSLSWEFLPGWLSQTLLEISENKFQSSFAATGGFTRTEPELAQTLVIPLSRQWTLEPTARYLAKYDKTLFQLSMPYSFESAKIWTMYSEGFRPPALIDLYANDPTYKGNPNLTPEESRQLEIGTSWNFQNFDFSTALFQVDYSNLLQGTVDSLGVFSKVNSGKARTQGWSTKITADFKTVVFHVGYSALLARAASKEALLFSPEHQVFSSLTYKKDSWSLALQQSLWSSFQDLNFTTGQQTRMAPWQSTDLLLFAQLNKKWNGSFGVYNLFDQKRELSFGYPEPQRRVALAIEYSF